jgi:hypothetical protein
MELRKTIWLTIFFVLCFTSCIKDVTNVKLPPFEQKLVISSFISPDIKANDIMLECNRNDYGEINFEDPPGKVSIIYSDGSNEIRIDTALIDTFKLYRIVINKLVVTEGKTYKVKVTNDKGLTAEASCTVPHRRDFQIEVDTTITFSTNQWSGKKYYTITANISITDFPGESNYYRLLFSVNGINVAQRIEDNVISDKGREGKKFVIKSITFASKPVDYTSDNEPYLLRIYLLNTNKAYYDYHKSLLTATLGSGGPFTEPSPVYSNVSNGVGIFAAYVVDSLIFRLK